jgi:hypothetical protein
LDKQSEPLWEPNIPPGSRTFPRTGSPRGNEARAKLSVVWKPTSAGHQNLSHPLSPWESSHHLPTPDDVAPSFPLVASTTPPPSPANHLLHHVCRRFTTPPTCPTKHRHPPWSPQCSLSVLRRIRCLLVPELCTLHAVSKKPDQHMRYQSLVSLSVLLDSTAKRSPTSSPRRL